MPPTVVTNQTTKTTPETPAQTAAVNALAVVGFVVLLIVGITLAIYSARYVPLAVSKLGSLPNNSNNSASLSVITASSTIPFGDQGSNVLTATTTTTALTPPIIAAAYTAPAVAAQPAPVAYPQPATYQQPVVSRAPALYGLPDLAVTIIATGYLSGPSTASFIPANIIPPGARPAIEFSVANDGTNTTGPWNFLAQIPSINNQIFNSPIEPPLNPGDHTVFTLGFNEAIPGPAQTITVVADPNNHVPEVSKANNTATARVTITQTGN